jgi:hypothetical protein
VGKVYGVWLTHYQEWLAADGAIISSDFKGLMKAQLNNHLRAGGAVAEVREIGDDGKPVEETNA